MTLDMTAIGVLISLALNSVNLLANVRSMLSAGEKKLEERMAKAENKLVDHDRRIQAVESELKHLPNKDMVNELKIAMAELRGTVDTLGETVASVSRTVHRIDDYLREDAKS